MFFKRKRKRKLFILPGVTDPIKQPIYENTNRSVEKWSRLIYFAVAKFTPTFPVILSICVISVIYFKRDLTDEDYVLPFPFWLVRMQLYLVRVHIQVALFMLLSTYFDKVSLQLEIISNWIYSCMLPGMVVHIFRITYYRMRSHFFTWLMFIIENNQQTYQRRHYFHG